VRKPAEKREHEPRLYDSAKKRKGGATHSIWTSSPLASPRKKKASGGATEKKRKRKKKRAFFSARGKKRCNASNGEEKKRGRRSPRGQVQRCRAREKGEKKKKTTLMAKTRETGKHPPNGLLIQATREREEKDRLRPKSERGRKKKKEAS